MRHLAPPLHAALGITMSSSAVASPLSAGNRASLNINAPATFSAAAGIIGGAALLGAIINPRQAALYVLGAALGVVLYHAAFGFTSAWRVFIADRRGEGLRAQMVMLAVAAALFFPVLASGTLFGQPVQGLVAPVGVSVLFGAFLFGIGMQLGGGCASGTLYTVGGGSVRMALTLAAFLAVWAAGGAPLLGGAALPPLPPISLVNEWGPWPALAA